MTPLTENELREMRERRDNSTGGAHRVFLSHHRSRSGAYVYNDEERQLLNVNERDAGIDHRQCLANAVFFAAARADVDKLLAEVDQLRADNRQLTNSNAHLQQEMNFLRRRPE